MKNILTLIVAKTEAKKGIILGLDIQTEYGLLIPNFIQSERLEKDIYFHFRKISK